MLTSFRAYLNTWIVRALFMVLVAAFALWGVADMVRLVSVDTTVATAAGQKLEIPVVQQAYQQQLAQYQRNAGANAEPTAEIRTALARRAVEQLITESAVAAQITGFGLVVPDDALRAAVLDLPGLRRKDGGLDRIALERMLQNAGLSEARFLGLLRSDLAQRQLLAAVRAGAVAPESMVQAFFDFRGETRTADAVSFPLASAPAPAAPQTASLERFWANHPDLFSTPELRRIKAVVLAPETIAKTVQVSDEELAAAYDQRRAEFDVPEKRSADVLLAQDEAKAKTLAEQWRGGADWAAMEKAARGPGGNAITLTDTTAAEVPIPPLAEALFAAKPDEVSGPVKTDIGYYVFKVGKITQGAKRSLEQVKDELRRSVALQKASDAIYDRANKIEDQLAGGAKLDELPGDVGLAAVSGTLDAKGDTASGTPAPIPGPAELRAALIAAAFQTKPGQPPHLTEVPAPAEGKTQPQASSYYALVVESVTPPAQKPFAEVQAAVTQAWTEQARRRAQEQAAATLYAAVRAGETLAAAAAKAGLTVTTLPPTGRFAPAAGVPSQLNVLLFSMKRGEATMVETPEGFLVATLTTITEPDPKADAVGYGRLRDLLTRRMGADIETLYLQAVRTEAKPHINEALLQGIAQP